MIVICLRIVASGSVDRSIFGMGYYLDSLIRLRNGRAVCSCAGEISVCVLLKTNALASLTFTIGWEYYTKLDRLSR